MDISVVVPLYNEEESLPELMEWIARVMEENQFSYEVVFVDDGSRDKSWEIVESLRKKYDSVKGIRFMRNYGKSAALQVGFTHVEGDVVITMDADLQDSPDEVPELYRMITEEGFDLVSGWKKKRYDPITKTIPTKLYNGVNRLISGIKLHDMNCGLKAYKKDVVKNIEVYGEMHRYIPVIAKASGFSKIGEKVVVHQARKYGVTKFGLNRFINGLLDLITITFMSKYLKMPMHFFGLWGTFFSLIGMSGLFYLLVIKLGHMFELGFGAPLGERVPAMFFFTIAFLLGILFLMTGLLSELIARNSPFKNEYNVRTRIGYEHEDK